MCVRIAETFDRNYVDKYQYLMIYTEPGIFMFINLLE